MDEQLIVTLRAEISQFTSQIRSAMDTLAQQTQRAQQSTQQLERGMTNLSSVAGTLRTALAGIGIGLTVRELVQFGQAVIQTANQMTNIRNAFTAITGSTNGAAEQIQFLRTQANRLGIDFISTAQGFQGIAAAARGTTLSTKQVQEVFVGVTEGARVMGLTTEQTRGALVAFEQMLSRGTVASEELRRQLGNAIPGSMQIAARAMGTTTKAIGDMLEQGQLVSTEFVPKFVRQWRSEIAGGVEAASRTFQAETNRMGNAWTEFLAALGQIVTENPAILQAIKDTAAGIASFTQTIKDNKASIDSWIESAIAIARVPLRAAANEMAEWQRLSKDMAARPPDPSAWAKIQRTIEDVVSILSRVTPLGDIFSPGTGGEQVDMLAAQLRELRAELATVTKSIETLSAAQERAPTQAQAEALAHLQERFATLTQQINAATASQQQFAAATAASVQAALAQQTARAQGEMLLGGGLQGAEGPSFLQQRIDLTKQANAQLQEQLANIERQGQLGLSQEAVLNAKAELLSKTLKDNTSELAKQPAFLAAQVPEVMNILKGWQSQLTTTKAQSDALKDAQREQNKWASDGVAGIKRIQAEIQHYQQLLSTGKLTPLETAAAQHEIAQLQAKLQSLTETTMPQVGQSIRETQREIDLLTAAMATEKDPLLLLAYKKELDELRAQQLPAALQEFGHLDREIADLARTIDAIPTLDIQVDDTQVDMARAKLARLRQEQFTEPLLLENRLPPEELTRFQQANEAAERRAQERIDKQKQQAQQTFDLDKFYAQSDTQRQQALETYMATIESVTQDEQALGQLRHNATMEHLHDIREQGLLEANQNYERRRLTALTQQQQDNAFQSFVDDMHRAGATDQQVNQAIFNYTQEQLQRSMAEWEHFADAVSGFLGDTIFNSLEGNIKNAKDLFKDLSETAGKFFAEIAAAAAKKWIMNLVVNGQVSTPQQQGGGGGGGGGIGSIFGMFGGGGGGGGATVPNADFTMGSGQLAIPTDTGMMQGPTQSGAPLGGGGMGMGGMGDYAAVAKYAMDLGFSASENKGAVATGRAAGGLVGSAVGSIWGVGSIVGPIVAEIGGLIGSLFATEPGLEIPTMYLPQFQRGQRGVNLGNIPDPSFSLRHQTTGETRLAVTKMLGEAEKAVFDPIIQQLQTLPPSFQNKLVNPMNAMASAISVQLSSFRAHGDDVVEDLNEFLTKEMPAKVQAVFGDMIEAIGKVAPLADELSKYIDAMRALQRQTLQKITSAQQSIEEGLFTPAQFFERRQHELQRKLTQFEAGGPAQQMRLAPQIADLAQEVFSLAKSEDVLGTDRPALRSLQRELLGILDEVHRTTKTDFKGQLDTADAQLKVLQDSLTNLQSIDANIAQVVDVIDQLNATFLKASGAGFQEGGPVLQTGFAKVHAGEYVLPVDQAAGLMHPGEMPSAAAQQVTNNFTQQYAPQITTHITVHVPPDTPVDAEGIARKVGQILERDSRVGLNRLTMKKR